MTQYPRIRTPNGDLSGLLDSFDGANRAYIKNTDGIPDSSRALLMTGPRKGSPERPAGNLSSQMLIAHSHVISQSLRSALICL